MENILRHAYLIIAHNEPDLLATLVHMIDDERNDIYIHIDSKSDKNQFRDIKTEHSHLFFVDRIDVRWGDISQVRAELLLMEVAAGNHKYSFYHIISGVDLPINSQDYIHGICEKFQDKSFVGFASGPQNEKDIVNRTGVYHIFTTYCRKKQIRLLSCIFNNIQKVIGIRRKLHLSENGSETILKKGCNWCSLTDEAVNYILSRKNIILREFRNTLCPDELFIQSVLWNSPLRKKLFGYEECLDEYSMCMREIDWDRGSPYTWQMQDFEYLMKSKKFFARKFSSQDLEIVKKIVNAILLNKP